MIEQLKQRIAAVEEWIPCMEVTMDDAARHAHSMGAIGAKYHGCTGMAVFDNLRRLIGDIRLIAEKLESHLTRHTDMRDENHSPNWSDL